MDRLTEREKEVFDYIVDVIRRDGYSPSVRDIQNALGIRSTSSVHTYLSNLEKKGYIQKESGKSRTVRVDNVGGEAARSARVPVLGRVAAGIPILAVENHESYIDFPLLDRSYRNAELFALRVRGESMIEAGILDGDLVVVLKTSVAEDGDIVVALIGENATVKTFYREGGRFRLQPENSEMEPIYVDELVILGRVISCMRFYPTK